jgi:hypothetical protein
MSISGAAPTSASPQLQRQTEGAEQEEESVQGSSLQRQDESAEEETQE